MVWRNLAERTSLQNVGLDRHLESVFAKPRFAKSSQKGLVTRQSENQPNQIRAAICRFLSSSFRLPDRINAMQEQERSDRKISSQ